MAEAPLISANGGSDAGYSREEVMTMGAAPPNRGPICPKCGSHIPRFVELLHDDESRLLKLICESRRMEAIMELRRITGCSIIWAKLWAFHCGKPLKTARARQCHYCLMDWHDPENVKSLGFDGSVMKPGSN